MEIKTFKKGSGIRMVIRDAFFYTGGCSISKAKGFFFRFSIAKSLVFLWKVQNTAL